MQFSHYLFLIFFRHGWGHLNLKDFVNTVDKDVIFRLISIKDKSLMRIREESELQMVSDDGGETTDTELNSSREGPMGIPEDQRTPRGSRHWSSESGSGASEAAKAAEAAEAAEAQSTTDDDIEIVDELFYVGSSDDDDDGDVEGRGRNWSSDHEHETESDENEENVPTDTSIVTVIESDRSNPPPAPQEQPGNATPGPSPTGPVPASGSGSPQLTHEPEPPQDEPNNNVAARTQRIVGDPQEDDSGSESDSDISDLTVDTVVALVHQDQPNEDEPTEP